MSTRARYTLLALQEFTDSDSADSLKGDWFAVGRRPNWSFELFVAAVLSGGSVTVSIEAAPEDDSDETYVREVLAFTAATGQATETKTATLLDVRDALVRAKVKSITGDTVLQVEGSAPFLDAALAADQNLLVKSLRDHSDLARIVEQAEADVLDAITRRTFLRADSETPIGTKWQAVINLPGAYEQIRLAIAAQAEWLWQTERLMERKDPSSIVSLRDRGPLAPDVMRQIDQFLPRSATAWRHR